jgi:hypothetical protein
MRAEQTNNKALLVLAGTATILLGCATAGAPDAIQTLSVNEFAKAPEAYRGRVVRICAERLANFGVDQPIWALSSRKAFGNHPATIDVLPCPSEQITAGKNICVVGRVARSGGSTELRLPGELIVRSPGSSDPWRLHAQCAVST